MGSNDLKRLEKEVAGEYNTFRMYLFMLKAKKRSARQAQKAFGFSSPWLATHHLEKLEKLGLVRKDDGDYIVIPRSFGILGFFWVTGRWIVPRSIFIVVIFAIMTLGFLLNLSQHQYFVVAFALSVVGLAYSIYQTIRFYRLLPKV